MKQILCFISVISWLFFIVFTEKGTEFLPAFNLICDFGGLAASFILVRNSQDATDIDEQINQMVIEHKKWCSKNQINVTPTLFYNGYKLPKGFNMVDVINL